jgi:arylsulfatase A-like enzyme
VFDRHVSDCPAPTAARRAWRTGRHQYPSPPTAVGGLGSDLLALLTARRVHAVIVRANRSANDAPPDFYAGWAEVFDARPDPAGDSRSAELIDALPGILDRLNQHPDWLLWVEIDRLLPPWEVPQDVFEVYVEELLGVEDSPAAAGEEPPDPWPDPPVGRFDADDAAAWELLHHSFAAAVTTFDADLGRVFDLFRGRGLDRDAAWVLTADYGFPLGEHGIVGPARPYLHEETVHVPLLVRLPAAAGAGRRVAAITQPADLMPSLLGLFGSAPPEGLDGHDLRPLWEGTAEAVRPHAVSGWAVGPAAEWAIRTPEWALLLPAAAHPDDGPRPAMLFEKPDDRWEVNDLRPRHLELAEQLEATLRQVIG